MSRPIALVTNDDGIQSGFLHALVKSLSAKCTVIVAAPKGERSWIGRAMSRTKDVKVEAVELSHADAAYSIDGTPSDCVNIAMGHLLDRKPDIVCSGINLGFNACVPVVLSSGTIAGAMEGAFWGVPAIAFSKQIRNEDFESIQKSNGNGSVELMESLDHAAKHCVEFSEMAIRTDDGSAKVHNVNFPIQTKAETIVEKTHLAPFRTGSLFQPIDTDPNVFRFKYSGGQPSPDGESDYACLLRGNISHTILSPEALG